ncbi:MAG: hypothetical protein EB060_05925, partial [Proteobacteria bacterium]|nr:hypothetical protein [Pseudomonadota bacterium]
MPLFDTDHIVSFNKEREGQEPFQGKPPYISVFEKDGKRLLFVATQHHAGAETGNSFVTID